MSNWSGFFPAFFIAKMMINQQIWDTIFADKFIPIDCLVFNGFFDAFLDL